MYFTYPISGRSPKKNFQRGIWLQYILILTGNSRRKTQFSDQILENYSKNGSSWNLPALRKFFKRRFWKSNLVGIKNWIFLNYRCSKTVDSNKFGEIITLHKSTSTDFLFEGKLLIFFLNWSADISLNFGSRHHFYYWPHADHYHGRWVLRIVTLRKTLLFFDVHRLSAYGYVFRR